MQFKVIRHHQGDKAYVPGDIREAVKGEVAHLIGTVLIEIDEAEAKRLTDEAAAAEEAEAKRLADEVAAASTGAARKK